MKSSLKNYETNLMEFAKNSYRDITIKSICSNFKTLIFGHQNGTKRVLLQKIIPVFRQHFGNSCQVEGKQKLMNRKMKHHCRKITTQLQSTTCKMHSFIFLKILQPFGNTCPTKAAKKIKKMATFWQHLSINILKIKYL